MKNNDQSGEKIDAPKPSSESPALVKCPNCRRWYAPPKGDAPASEALTCPYCGMRNEDVHIA